MQESFRRTIVHYIDSPYVMDNVLDTLVYILERVF